MINIVGEWYALQSGRGRIAATLLVECCKASQIPSNFPKVPVAEPNQPTTRDFHGKPARWMWEAPAIFVLRSNEILKSKPTQKFQEDSNKEYLYTK